MTNKTSLTQKQKKFLEYYLESGEKKSSGIRAGVTPPTVHNWFKKQYFLDALEEAQTDYLLDLRAAAMKRAREKSDTLAIFFLKAARPELYDDAIRKMLLERELGAGEAERKPEVVVYNIMPKPDK